MRGLGFQTFVMLGDGETQEGMVWESVMVAARYGLGNLTAIVDCNGLQQYGWPRDAGRRRPGRPARSAGRRRSLRDALRPSAGASSRSTGTTSRRSSPPAPTPARRTRHGRPTAILARTVKGRGVSFLEDRFEWHARVATADEVAAAAVELAPADPADPAGPAAP